MKRPRLRFLVLPIVAIVGLTLLLIPPRTGQAEAHLSGTLLHGRPAPDFAVRDQTGRLISLHSLRSRPVVLTFIEASCTELCPLVAEKIQQAVASTERAGGKAEVIAISTAPEDDTPAAVRSFLHAHSATHWHYIVAKRKVLARIWRSYYIYAAPASAPKVVRDAHTSAMYLIDKWGRERVLLVGNPEQSLVTQDVRILAGVPAAAGAVADGPSPGERAPNFSVRLLNGKDVSLRSLRGQTVLLNFWATWCAPCKHETPRLAAAYRSGAPYGLTVVGIDKQESRSDVEAFLKPMHVSYPVAIDQNGALSGRYGLTWMPTSFLIDAHGIVRARRTGMIDTAWLSHNVRPLLKASLSSDGRKNVPVL